MELGRLDATHRSRWSEELDFYSSVYLNDVTAELKRALHAPPVLHHNVERRGLNSTGVFVNVSTRFP